MGVSTGVALISLLFQLLHLHKQLVLFGLSCCLKAESGPPDQRDAECQWYGDCPINPECSRVGIISRWFVPVKHWHELALIDPG